jgi:hypothetical protein
VKTIVEIDAPVLCPALAQLADQIGVCRPIRERYDGDGWTATIHVAAATGAASGEATEPGEGACQHEWMCDDSGGPPYCVMCLCDKPGDPDLRELLAAYRSEVEAVSDGPMTRAHLALLAALVERVERAAPAAPDAEDRSQWGRNWRGEPVHPDAWRKTVGMFPVYPEFDSAMDAALADAPAVPLEHVRDIQSQTLKRAAAVARDAGSPEIAAELERMAGEGA